MLTKMPVFSRMVDRPFAHCATLIDLGEAGLQTAWMGGSYETAPDVVLLAARLLPGTDHWTEPRVIAEAAGHSLGQPVFLPRPDGELWLFFVVIAGRDWTSAAPYLQKSFDGGETWGAPVRLFDKPGLMLRSRVIVLPNRLILPAYDENTWQSCMILSDDEGKTWRMTKPMASPNGNIHPTIVTADDGSLIAYLRTGGKGGVIWRSVSLDQGETWSPLEATPLPNPNAGLDILRLSSGRYALAYNPSATHRTPLAVALADANERWRWRRIIEDEFAEISYPTLAQTRDGKLHLVYTYRREAIHYAQFTEDWLLEERLDL